MNLNELSRKNYAVKALKESFNYEFDTKNLNNKQATAMLNKVRTLKSEMKAKPGFYENQTNGTYMKLVFMEEALTDHILNNKTVKPQIVFENEEVDKSEVILAAQDLLDSVQKMLEQTSDMLVKELPALYDSMTSEIGVNESQQFNQEAVTALSNLQSTLFQTKSVLQSALDGITSQGGEGFTASGMDGLPPGGEMPGTEPQLGAEPMAPELPAEEPVEEPEIKPLPKVGREKR